MEWIGRPAFPLFAFMIAEGCKYTKSMPGYIFRLLILAIISQPFYHFALDNPDFAGWSTVSYALRYVFPPNNAMVTLTLGALVVWIYKLCEESGKSSQKWLIIPVLWVFWFAAEKLRSDYGGFGVVLIFLLYATPNLKRKTIAIVVWATTHFLIMYALSGGQIIYFNPVFGVETYKITQWFFASMSALLILVYNGERGRQTKWLFYGFYPAHLLVLYALEQIY
jgi:hypothetical protein